MNNFYFSLFLFSFLKIIALAQHNFTVFGYLPEYRLSNFDYDGAFSIGGLTHLIFFSLEVDTVTGLPSALDRLPSTSNLEKARNAAKNVSGKILISFGGHSRSQGFGSMTATKIRRSKFINSLNSLLKDLQLDGVDLNWEYPNNNKEWSNLYKLIKELKENLLDGTNIVTFTMYLDPNHYNIIKRYRLLDHADYVHCMAYDYQGKHSTYEFAKKGISLAKSNGLDHSKWTLGVPFYGRHVHTGEARAYYELKLANNRTDSINNIYFNSQTTLKKKVILGRSEKIGGVMIWELGQDKQPFTSASLLHAIKAGLLHDVSFDHFDEEL